MKPYGRTTPLPLRHRQIDKLNMFDWIRDCAETGKRMPTDAEITERFGFTQPEQARTLLADLSDAGKITIIGTGDDREILLGRVRPSQRTSIERPVPSVIQPGSRPTSAKQGAGRIANILRGATSKMTEPKAAVEQLQAAGATLSEGGKTIAEQLAPIVEAAQADETSIIDARPVKAATLAAIASAAPFSGPTRQINATLQADPELYERITVAARSEGLSVSRYVGQIARAALTQPPAQPAPQPERKPLLRADMTAAAIRNGMPIDAFVRMLIERGFQTFLADEQKELAA